MLTLIWVAYPWMFPAPTPLTSHSLGGFPGRLFSRQMIEVGGQAARDLRAVPPRPAVPARIARVSSRIPLATEPVPRVSTLSILSTSWEPSRPTRS
ncbi:hypothetical protein, partial [Streptosporangium sp. NPDC048865]|uniref:hypothetical protein n=1 Tax=Streptosporangium sp. NPDC048865 TaxID=3155766 RepID=UPI003440FB2A